MLLSEIKHVFNGVFPSTFVTVSEDETPNICNLSKIWYVDDRHIAIANQFLNKTLRNLLDNPLANLKIADPDDLLHFELGVRLVRGESKGLLYERIERDLNAVYWLTGSDNPAPLRSVLLFEVMSVRKCMEEAGHLLPAPELYGDLLDVLDEVCGWSRTTYWIHEEDGGADLRLAASRGVPGAGMDHAVFEPMRRLAKLVLEQKQAIRLQHIRSQLRYFHTIKAVERAALVPSADAETTGASTETPFPAEHAGEEQAEDIRTSDREVRNDYAGESLHNFHSQKNARSGLPELPGSVMGMPVTAFDTVIGVVCCEGEKDADPLGWVDDRYAALLSRRLGEAVFPAAAVSGEARKALFRQAAERAQLEWRKAADPFYTALSARERQVAVHAAKGLTNAEIGKALYISTRTVTTHMERIFQKLEIASRAALARYVVENKLLMDDDGGS